jgi:hypothetical protein
MHCAPNAADPAMKTDVAKAKRGRRRQLVTIKTFRFVPNAQAFPERSMFNQSSTRNLRFDDKVA